MPDKPMVLATTWRDGYGREYQMVDARLLAQAEKKVIELRDLNTRLLEKAVNGDA
jgi:hypothetical protein